MFSQERIRNARFMVVGCGALGNEVLKNLALFGAEHIVLVDFDEVEAGNLSRSVLFTRQDAESHRRKVQVAARRLTEMNPRMEVVPMDGDIAYDVGLGWIRRTDVVIGCVDSRWARYCINRLCMRAGVPWVDGGISQLEGTVRVFAPGENCYACSLGPEGGSCAYYTGDSFHCRSGTGAGSLEDRSSAGNGRGEIHVVVWFYVLLRRPTPYYTADFFQGIR